MSDHRKLDHGPWSWCAKAAEDRALLHPVYGGANLLLVYHALCRIESDTPTIAKGCFYASAKGISSRCGLGERTVERTLPGIAAAGLAVVISGRKSGVKGERGANQYTLLNFGQSATVAVCSPPPSPDSMADNKERRKPLNKDRRFAGSGAKAPAASGENKENSTADDWIPVNL
jgi:hypothetical protein